MERAKVRLVFSRSSSRPLTATLPDAEVYGLSGLVSRKSGKTASSAGNPS
jgi:hypothetical protein